jgi:tRNA A-37 threonylcarbamoyl transferase component Bud32
MAIGPEDDFTRVADTNADLTRPVESSDQPAASNEAARPVSQGRYRLGATLGEGGMAVVLEAEDVQLKRRVAIKQLRDGLRDDAAARQRFFAEAEILAGLDHSGVVSVHEAGLLEDGGPFYAMARVKGSTLGELLAADPAAGYRVPLRLVEVVQRAAETMGHAHALGLLHMDLKPHNIMVDEDGAVYVMDWGIAQRAADISPSDRGVFRGTPAYMSPEVASGRADLASPRSDVFAIGVILYEVLTGRRPFTGDTPQILKGVAGTTPPDPHRLARHVPRELSAICMKAMARDPAARYATARQLANDLRDYRSFLPISAIRPTFRDRAAKWMRRHPKATTALATAAVALLVFGSIRAYRVAAERALQESLWSQYVAISSDVDQLDAELAEFDRSPLPAGATAEAVARRQLARQELAERIELRANDARTIAAATLGLTRGQPSPRVVEALSSHLHRDIERKRAEGDLVGVMVLAETRLALFDELQGRITWPAEELDFLRRTAAESREALARQLAGTRGQK